MLGEIKTTSVADEDWEVAKYEAMDIIQTHIGGTIESEIVGLENPHKMWNSIKEMFTDRKGIEKCIALTNLMNCKMGNNTEKYIKKFGLLRGKCIEIGWKFEDIFYAINLVNNVNEEYGAIKQLLLAKGDALTYKEAMEILMAEGLNQLNSSLHDNGLKVEHWKHKNKIKGTFYKCSKAGHFIRECPKWKKLKKTQEFCQKI